VDNNADFSSPVLNKSGITASSRTLGTLADGTYYWRVRVVDGAGNTSAWTAAWSFTVDIVTPSVPALLYPANGTVTSDTTPWLDWSDVTDATGVQYRLQVDNNADFSSPVVNKSGLTLSSRTLSTLASGTYYWRVMVVDGAGNASVWTSGWSFTVVM
jgi:predicted phage tail protein